MIDDEAPPLVRMDIETRHPEKYLLVDTGTGDIWVAKLKDGRYAWTAIDAEDPRLEALDRLLIP